MVQGSVDIKMTLSMKQRIFTKNIGLLIAWAYSHGYELTFGEALRSDEQAEINALGVGGRLLLINVISPTFQVLADKIRNNGGSGIRNTLHERKLAVDFNLFVNGSYMSQSESYQAIGTFWKTLDPLNRWGGDFPSKDGNHFSMEDGGVK